MDWCDFLTRVVEIILGFFSIAFLITLWELRYTTKRLKNYVASYMESVEFPWQNQTDEFTRMHRVRSFEILLRKVQILQPRTPGAYKRATEVQEVLEHFHKAVPIFRGEHLPLPNLGEFPVVPNDGGEAFVRDHVIKGLRAIKWLGLKEPAEQ